MSRAPSRELLSLLKLATRRGNPSSTLATRCFANKPTRRTVATHTSAHFAQQISILPTVVDKNSADYKENARQMDEAVARLSELHAQISQGGPQKARDKHVARGKMLPREFVSPSPS